MPDPTLPPCPTPCDDHCELNPDGCHESHVPGHGDGRKRAHQPWACEDIRKAIAAAVAAERERIAQQIDPAQLDALAEWFDADDAFKVAMFHEQWPRRGHEVQDDLRRWAKVLRGESGNDS